MEVCHDEATLWKMYLSNKKNLIPVNSGTSHLVSFHSVWLALGCFTWHSLAVFVSKLYISTHWWEHHAVCQTRIKYFAFECSFSSFFILLIEWFSRVVLHCHYFHYRDSSAPPSARNVEHYKYCRYYKVKHFYLKWLFKHISMILWL